MSFSVTVPTINANDESVIVVRWLVTEGAEIAAGAPLVDVETTKSVVTIDAPIAGRVRRGAAEGAEVAVGAEIARIEGSEIAQAAEEPAVARANESAQGGGAGDDPTELAQSETPASLAVASPLVPPPVSAERSGAVRLSREAQRLVQERGLDVPRLLPNASGLVTAEMLRAAVRGASATGTGPAEPRLRRERVPADKRAEIAALREGAADGLRSSLSVYFDSEPVRAALGSGPGVLAHLLAEVARLVAAQPAFAAWHEGAATIFHDAVHLGVAMDLGEGLRVVTLRDAAACDAASLEAQLAERMLACQERRLTPEEASGSTFTVTDLSGLDVLHFEPLLNGKQSAILGVGGDATLPGHPMSLTLAFDHRVLTGRQVAAFLRELRARMEALGRPQPKTPFSSATPGPVAAELTPEPPCCDRCGVEAADYYARFGRAGLMQNYTRADGSTGRICHTCVALS
jgi:2-oxoglutarate dehydrogenase E2 component (dihydrolipoamide succinyltransferase)